MIKPWWWRESYYLKLSDPLHSSNPFFLCVCMCVHAHTWTWHFLQINGSRTHYDGSTLRCKVSMACYIISHILITLRLLDCHLLSGCSLSALSPPQRPWSTSRGDTLRGATCVWRFSQRSVSKRRTWLLKQGNSIRVCLLNELKVWAEQNFELYTCLVWFFWAEWYNQKPKNWQCAWRKSATLYCITQLFDSCTSEGLVFIFLAPFTHRKPILTCRPNIWCNSRVASLVTKHSTSELQGWIIPGVVPGIISCICQTTCRPGLQLSCGLTRLQPQLDFRMAPNDRSKALSERQEPCSKCKKRFWKTVRLSCKTNCFKLIHSMRYHDTTKKMGLDTIQPSRFQKRKVLLCICTLRDEEVYFQFGCCRDRCIMALQCPPTP